MSFLLYFLHFHLDNWKNEKPVTIHFSVHGVNILKFFSLVTQSYELGYEICLHGFTNVYHLTAVENDFNTHTFYIS